MFSGEHRNWKRFPPHDYGNSKHFLERIQISKRDNFVVNLADFIRAGDTEHLLTHMGQLGSELSLSGNASDFRGNQYMRDEFSANLGAFRNAFLQNSSVFALSVPYGDGANLAIAAKRTQDGRIRVWQIYVSFHPISLGQEAIWMRLYGKDVSEPWGKPLSIDSSRL